MPRFIPPLGGNTFLGLTDTPSSYAGKASYFVKVRPTEDGLYFVPLWLMDWRYRKKITIAGSTGAGTGCQVLLKVGESSGSTGADFHLEGHSAKFPSDKNDGGDLRFIASDEATLLDFWVEKVDGTSPNRVAYIWVKVLADLGTNQDIYIYYNNPNATNYSNGDNTFLFFDDFNEKTVGTKWQRNDGTTMQDTESTAAYIDSPNERAVLESASWQALTTKTFYATRPVIIETKALQNGSFGSYAMGIQFYDPATSIDFNKYSYHIFTDGTYVKARIAPGTTFTDYTGEAVNLSLGTYYIVRMELTSSNVIGRIFNLDRTLRGSISIPEVTHTTKKVGIDNFVGGFAGYPSYFDWFLVRKYVSPEPTFLSAGAEEVV